MARYTDWVEGARIAHRGAASSRLMRVPACACVANLERVQQLSGGSVGYVHVPDMEAWGFAQFHRYFLVQSHLPALIGGPVVRGERCRRS